MAAQGTGIEECAELTAEMLRARGLQTEVMPTEGAPVVYGERKGREPRTLIFYNHYDVQPPDPLELWESPPFEPQVRDGKLFARGVSDNKGHLVNRLFTIDAMLDAEDQLPCTVKFIVEGEEEVGSPNLEAFIKKNAAKLAADACIWEGGGVDHQDRPQQILGMRGCCYVEISVQGTSVDVHSGIGGTILPNAAWRLVWALNTLKDRDERIRIPGYYDNVVPPTERDVELMAALPDVAEDYKRTYGVKEFLKGVTGGAELRMQEVFEPSCTICGLTSGYQGPKGKTVLPARASAKIDFRLVPNQTPEEVRTKLRSYLDSEGFSDVEVICDESADQPAGRTDPDDPFAKLVSDAAAEAHGKPSQIIPMIGGSGPWHIFTEYLKLPVVMAGCWHPGCAAHAPNENLRLDLYLKGASQIVRILSVFAQG